MPRHPGRVANAQQLQSGRPVLSVRTHGPADLKLFYYALKVMFGKQSMKMSYKGEIFSLECAKCSDSGVTVYLVKKSLIGGLQ